MDVAADELFIRAQLQSETAWRCPSATQKCPASECEWSQAMLALRRGEQSLPFNSVRSSTRADPGRPLLPVIEVAAAKSHPGVQLNSIQHQQCWLMQHPQCSQGAGTQHGNFTAATSFARPWLFSSSSHPRRLRLEAHVKCCRRGGMWV